MLNGLPCLQVPEGADGGATVLAHVSFSWSCALWFLKANLLYLIFWILKIIRFCCQFVKDPKTSTLCQKVKDCHNET